jgi:asparagine synthase (glutamine-hydrolysing)
MCGIAGLWGATPSYLDAAFLDKMKVAIRHRGPDDEGVAAYPEEGFALIHTRLSIQDLSAAGHQPMWTEDGRHGIVFNGEIYNFPEVRQELTALGHVFRSHSDTEVLLRGYAQWGKELLGRINGMFAFALVDRVEGTLWLVRDRTGIKPLYYHWNEALGTLIFASEIKALLAHPLCPREMDPDSVRLCLALGYLPAPWSPFRGIQKLPAGQWMELGRGGVPRMHTYWQPPAYPEAKPFNEKEVIEEWRELFYASLKRRLVSDLPVGAYLSGGVDSTLVVSAFQKLADAPVHTFSAAYDVGARSFKYNVDADAAERVSREIGTKHTRVTIAPTPDELRQVVRDCVRHLEEPLGNPTCVSTFLLAREVKRHGFSVVLCGDGSDEIFGGYSRYQADLAVDYASRVPRTLLDAALRLARLLSPAKAAAFAKTVAKTEAGAFTLDRLMGWWWQFAEKDTEILGFGDNKILRDRLRQVFAAALPAAKPPSPWSNRDALELADLTAWIPEENNLRMDKTSMAFALETREPFQDYHLIESAMKVPFRHKAAWKKEKELLKKAFAPELPKFVGERDKWGWISPVFYWVRNYLWDDIEREIRGLVDEGVVSARVLEYLHPFQPMHQNRIWSLYTFGVWRKQLLG